MKLQTETLTGAQLVYAVALAEGYKFGAPKRLPNVHAFLFPLSISGQPMFGSAGLFSDGWSGNVPKFCTGPAGDAIIDREKIMTMWDATGQWKACLTPDENEPHYYFRQYGATRREAAMRCWVLYKLGPEIEIHEVIK